MFEHFMPRRGKKRSKQSRGARPFERNHWLPAGRSPSPVIELLEMRALLSAVSVTDLNDDGTSNSLRAAFNTATGGETMTLSAGTYSLTQGELNIGTISGTLTIVGQTTASGAPATIIDQLSLDRVIQIAAGASVTFENIEITGGVAVDDGAGGTSTAEGGGILFGGALDSNGLPLTNDGTLTLTNVLVAGNKALATSASAAAFGGGVDSTGTLIVGAGSVIEGNSALVANTGESSYGGGIFSASAGQLTVTDSTIANNTSVGGSGASGTLGAFGLGGGIYISNSGTAASVFTDDMITGNQAIGGNAGAGTQGGYGVGGGIEVDKGAGNSIATGASVTIANTTFAYNLAQGGAGGSGTGGDAYGGAGDLNTSGSVLLNDTFYGNTALGGDGVSSGNGFGGGIEDDTAFDPNPGSDTVTGGLTIVNATFASNIAQGGVANGGTSGTGTGGGIGNDAVNPDGTLVVKNTIIAGNTADVAPDVFGSAESTDHNLIGDYDSTQAGGFSVANGDQLGTSGSPINPKLGPLQNNGGDTNTVALLGGSPAIGAGDNAAATAALTAAGLPSTDQRGTGFSRIVGGTVDIGAYEVQTTQATTTTLGSVTSPINVGQSVTLTATVTATGTPTGVVTFEDTINGTTTNLGTATVTGGMATLQVLALPVGTNSITAAYSGDATFSGSISTAKSEMVNLSSGLALAASTTIADGEAGSLRDAIAKANANTGTSGETIVLSAGTYLLTLGELSVTNTNGTLTIIGQGSTGPNATIIDQAVEDRIVQIAAGASVTFENVEITGGLAATDDTGSTTNVAVGGGILAGGDPSVTNDGTLVLSNVVVDNNKSLAVPGSGTGVSAYGGGVLSTGNLTIGGGSVISGNSAVGAAGASGTGSGGGAAGGGAIFWLSSGTATISNSAVTGNVIEAGAGDGVAGAGGVASGGGVYISNSGTGLANLTNDTVSGNESLATFGSSANSGNSAFGGGIFSNGSGPIQINGTTVANNTAIAGTGATGVSGTNGDDGVAGDGDDGGIGVAGGIYISNSGPTAPTLTGDIVTNNTVHGGAGGAGANGSGGTGGVVFGGGVLITQGSGAIPVSNSLIANNTAQGGAGGAAGTGGTAGDGGDAAGGGFLTAATGTQLLDSTVFGNTVTGGSGHNAGNAFGGGVEDETGFGAPTTGMSLVNVTVVSNTAQAGTQSGGTSGSAFGGGIDNDDKLDFGGTVIAADTALVVTNTLVAENKAEDHTGAEVEANGPDVFGAASTADHDLVGDGTGASGFTAAGNQVGTSGSPINPKLGPLQNNGGTSETLALLTGSPALAAGDAAAATAAGLTTDQRGLARIVSGKTDIGAFETQAAVAAPVVTASGTVNTVTVGGTAVAVDSGITVSSSDVDLTGAKVTISSGTLQTGDSLHFTTQNGITGSFSAGVLTLSGSATPAQYQTALRSVTFSTTSTNTTARAMSVVALDNALTSNSAAESVKVAIGAPVVTPSGTTSKFTVGGAAVAVDASLTVSSFDTDLTGATVTISPGTLQTGDTLHFTTQNGISGNFSGGVLTLSGSATVANYQTALRSVTFSTTSNSSVARSLAIVALDNSLTSDAATESVTIVTAPIVTASGAVNVFTLGGTAVAIDSGIVVASNDTDLTGATVTISPSTLQTGDTLHFNTQNGITGNFSAGVLTLSGNATPAQYQTALQSVTFSTSGLNITTRTVSVVALDNSLTSNAAAESVKVAVVAPVVTASGATSTFTVGGSAVPVDAGVTVTSDDADLTGATMTISSGTLQTGDTLNFTTQNGISGSFSGGVLTLSGSATPTQYQTALQSVTFSTTSNSPVTRSVSIVALDNSATSNSVAKSVKVIAAPVVTASGATNTFTVGGTAVAIDSGIVVSSNDTDLTGATVTISPSTLQTGDTLNFTTQNGISGNFSAGVLTLSGSATPAQYQTALQSVTFSSTSTNSTTRAISVVAVDNALTSSSAAESVKVAFAPPVLTASGATNTFTVGGTAVAVDSGMTVTSDDTDLTGATVTISSGTLQTGDTLNFSTQNGISGNFSGGVLTLSGSATPAQYQTALQSVTFSTTSNSPVARSVSIVALDNALTSNSVTESVKIIAAPVVTASGATNTFTVGGTAVAVDSAITVTSNDTDLTGATLTISSGTLQTGDTLNFSTQNGITGSFSGGVLTLSGSATVANYQTALQSVTFSTTSTNATTRAIAVVALDNALTSTSAAESVQVTAATASLSGTAYDDVNQQGTFDTSEATLDNITITLTGTDSSGNAVNQTAQTSASGTYTFSSLVAGTYSLAATMPTDLMAGTATAGNDGGTAAGETVNSITLAAGAAGTGYNFGAYGLAPQFISINLFLASTPSNSELLNQEPTISTLADQTVNPGASTPATPFTVSDPLASAASLTVSGTSSNTTLVPNANIVYAGSGADRTVTVTPAAGQTGTATITTTVSDSYGSQSNAGFKLNVAANPVVTPSSAANTFTTGGSAVAVDSGVTVSSSDTDLTGATVTISSDTLQSSDLLNFVNQNGITGNYTAGMLTLSGSATPAQYQAALQSVTFSTTSTSTTTRSLSIVALDNALTSNSAAESVQVSTGSTPAVTSASLAQSATDAALAGEDDWTS